jgi:hypothetical protein
VIVRVLRGHVSARNASQLWASLAERMSGIGPPAGRLGAIFGRQINGDGSEGFVYVTTWVNMEAVYDWVGGPDLISMAGLMRDLEFLLDDFEVQHFLGGDMATAWSLDATEAVLDEADAVAADGRPAATTDAEVPAGARAR